MKNGGVADQTVKVCFVKYIAQMKVGISNYGENLFLGQASHAVCQRQETGC